MTMLRNLFALLTSRRVVVLLGAGILFAAKWRILGKPDGAEWSSMIGVVIAWAFSESSRRHDGALVTSRRFLVGLLSQVVPTMLAMLGVVIPAEALAMVNGLVVAKLLGEGVRRHEVADEDEPPADGQ